MKKKQFIVDFGGDEEPPAQAPDIPDWLKEYINEWIGPGCKARAPSSWIPTAKVRNAMGMSYVYDGTRWVVVDEHKP
jgi:hypothetical protein